MCCVMAGQLEEVFWVEGLGPGKVLEDRDPLGLAGLLGIRPATAAGGGAAPAEARPSGSTGATEGSSSDGSVGIVPPGNVTNMPSGIRMTFSEQVRGMRWWELLF